jgi:lipopolysaccharide transport system ATP-binding protein
MRPIVKVENLGKQYRLGGAESAYETLREALVRAAQAPFGRWRRDADDGRFLWALKGVNFEVRPGEVVGIIGRNGAGKSTLLKVLSRITEPTTGRVELYGRVGSLLEVGTGFHPELTGRENIFLNGAILGMRREEIAQKFDEIVAFSEIEKFLDTPVKRYSSGMYVRLAFAVAAHLESEIMIVDEVLAVGDAKFQRKCLGKLGDVKKMGRTILLVSHNMPNILRLCERVILLDRGEVVADGGPDEVIGVYMNTDAGIASERIWPTPEEAPGDAVARLHAVRVLSHEGQALGTLEIGREIFIEIEYWNLQSADRPFAALHLINEDGVCLFVSTDFNNAQWQQTPPAPGLVTSTCRIPANFLAEGRFFISAAVCTFRPIAVVHAMEPDSISFQVVDNSKGEGVRGSHIGSWPGLLRPMLEWEVETKRPRSVSQ